MRKPFEQLFTQTPIKTVTAKVRGGGKGGCLVAKRGGGGGGCLTMYKAQRNN